MKLPRRQFLHLAAGAAALPALSRAARAQAYPTRPVTIVVPYPAGGPTDVVARIMAERMQVSLAQPVVIENVAGANGSIGTGRVARAAPDGYTLSFGAAQTHVFNSALYALSYDTFNNFEPVSLLASFTLVIVTKQTMPAKDLRELIAWLTANPGKASQGSAGVGSSGHVAGVFFRKETGTSFQFVTYRGLAPAMQDLVAGQIDFMFDSPITSLPQVRAGAVKAYAVTAKSRLPSAPDIPTVDEAGLPGFYASSWFAIWAPKGTPKGGSARRAAIGTYDSFNMVVAGVKGNLAQGIEVIYDTLMAPSLDEVASEYGLIAEAVRYPADFSWVSFRLRPGAKWHDGRAISLDDVIYSLEVFKRLHPRLASYYRHVVRTEKIGENEVRFVFDAPGIRELPQILGELTVLPKHWWEGVGNSGERRDISQTTLEPPLGSGAYRIKTFEPGRSIVYELVPDYWAKELPINVGTDNLGELRFDYFRDAGVAFEAFKAGALDWRTENVAKNWATEYDFPAVLKREVVREEFPIRSVGTMQAFAFNIRRPKFRDPRVRRAFNFAFDFEKINQELFYGAYTRISSYFDGTELASSGLPEGRELELLKALRSEVPPEVFTTPYWNPVSNNDAAERARGISPSSTPILASRWKSSSSSVTGVSTGSLCSTSRSWSVLASRSRCGASTMYNTSTACGIRISISLLQAGRRR
jgi:tripartite-type tricarboxylate transporter receptor subunit TctC